VTPAERKYFIGRFSALRNALDEVLGELQSTPEDSAPRIRRNIKKERIERHETNYAIGKWSKPASLKAQK
jgi:hypothetical protein